MSKLPFMKFFPDAYVRDTRALSLDARGAWMDLICSMWYSPTRGKITLPLSGFARLFSVSVSRTKVIISEITNLGICESVTDGNGDVTVSCRRMLREENERESIRCRVKRFRNAHKSKPCNGSVTVEKLEVILQKSEKNPPTPLAGADAQAAFDTFWELYPKHAAKASAVKAWRNVNRGQWPAILEALAWQLKQLDWTKENGKFVPHAATWLNAKRWEDERPGTRGNGSKPNLSPDDAALMARHPNAENIRQAREQQVIDEARRATEDPENG